VTAKFHVSLRIILVTAVALSMLSNMGCGGDTGGDKKKDNGISSERSVEREKAEVSFRTLGGKRRTLSDYSGKILMVNYIASWNVESRDLVSIMNAVHSKFKRNVTVIGVIVDEGGSGRARSFKTQNDVRFELLLPDGKTGKDQRSGRLLTTVIYTRDGKLFKRFDGLQRQKVYEDFLRGMYRRRM
jgi:hypothetical protein